MVPPDPAVLLAGSAIDATHALSMLTLLSDHPHIRRAAATSAALAASYAVATAICAQSSVTTVASDATQVPRE